MAAKFVTRFRGSLLGATALVLGVALDPPAWAQDAGPSVQQLAQAQQRTFNIPPQSLEAALLEFGRQSGRQIVSHGDLVRGLSSPGVQGTMTVEAALQQLLAGTGLTYTTSGGAISLQKPGAGVPGTMQLDPVRVQGDQPPPQAEIGQPAKPYAGGMVDRNNRVGVLGNRDYMDTPFSVTTYSEKTIKEQQAVTLMDVMAVDPTVRSQYSQNSFDDRMWIRGFPLVMTDVAFNGLYSMFISSAGVAGIDRVEVFRGPTALLSGMAPRGAVGGSINLVPKRATDEDINQVTARYGANSQLGGAVDVGRRFGPNKEVGVRANAAYIGGNTPIANNYDQVIDLALGVDFRSDRTRLDADIGYLQRNINGIRYGNFLAAGVPLPAAPSNAGNFYSPALYSNQNNLYGLVRFEHDLAPELTAYLKVGGQRSNSNNLVEAPTITNYVGNTTSTMTTNLFFYESLNAEVGARGRFETGPIHHELVASGNYLLTSTGNRSIAFGPVNASNIYNPTYNYYPVIPPGANTAPVTTNQTLFKGIGIVDALSFAEERVQLIGGVRLQSVQASNYNNVTGLTTTATPGYDQSAVTPSVSLVVRPWKELAVYGNYIEALETGAVVGAVFANAGQVFPPFVSKQFEVGVKLDMGYLGGTLSAFQITKPSVITNVAANTQSVDCKQRNQGIEFMVFGEPFAGFRPLAGFTALQAIQTNTAGGINNGKYAPGVPGFMATVGLDYDTPFLKGLTVGGRVIYTGQAPYNAANTQWIPAWTRVDLSAAYRFERADGKPLILRANVNNVGNANYWLAAAGYLGQGAPRTYMLSLAADF